jgi:hypothetical protein
MPSERDVVLAEAYDVYVATRVKPLEAAFDHLWNASRKHRDAEIANLCNALDYARGAITIWVTDSATKLVLLEEIKKLEAKK